MNIDTHGRSVAELLQEWRDLARDLRDLSVEPLLSRADAADCIELLCNACEEYESQLANVRELLTAERASSDAQLSDAIAEISDLRAAIVGEDPEMPTSLAPIGTLAAVLSQSRDWAEKYRSEDEDPAATQEMLNDAGAAIERMAAVARGVQC